MKIIFTDIDGVLNPNLTRKWNQECVDVYNRICNDFNLYPVITSTWRLQYNQEELQQLFINQGITTKIYDYTPYLRKPRGLEIYTWLKGNDWSQYVVIDDRVESIKPYVSNVIHCKGWIGLTEKHYDEIKKILDYGGKRR